MWEEGQGMIVLYPVLQAPGFGGSQVQTVHSVPQQSLSVLGSARFLLSCGVQPFDFSGFRHFYLLLAELSLQVILVECSLDISQQRKEQHRSILTTTDTPERPYFAHAPKLLSQVTN